MFDFSAFMPHGACYLWRQDILLLHVGSDLFITLAYLSIPAAMIVFMRRRPDIPFSGIFRLFVGFILACGITHLFSIVVVWYPAYAIEGLLKLATAAVSVATAVALWALIPKAVTLPSPKTLQARNEEIQALNEQLTARVDSLGTLAGGVAHDFNNLLTVIKGNAELLVSSVDSGSDKEGLTDIMEASERATQLCRQMLAYSGKGHFMLSPTDLNEVIRNTEVPGDSPSNIHYNYSLSENIKFISAASEQVQQLLVDLVNNAVEAIQERHVNTGEITVATYLGTLDDNDLSKAVTEHSAVPGEFVILEVRDNGIGIHRDTIIRIFDPFYSTKFTGRGLGLSAAQGIVRGHEGCILVDSEPGRGTTFTVAFPVAKSVPASYRAKMPGEGIKPVVLVVDDEKQILELARSYLKRLAFEVVTTSEPSRVPRLVQQYNDRLEAVILDYLMPRTTGREVLQKIRKISSVHVYLTSGFSRGEINDAYLREEASGFIPKPFSFADFQEIFARAQEHRED